MNEKEPTHIVLICIDIEINGMIGDERVQEISKFEEYLKNEGNEVTVITREAIGVEKVFKECSQRVVDEIIKNCLPVFSSQLETADIIHSFNWISGACGSEISKKYQVRHLHSFDSLGRMKIEDKKNLTEQQRFLDTWELKIFENAESVIAPNSYLAENFVKLYPGKFHKKLNIIQPGIDHELFSPGVLKKPGSGKLFFLP